MKQFYLTLLAAFIFMNYADAQTKIFREISDDISTEFKAIVQNGDLIGYLSFTELERADKDSFNYKITIMDENLNDLGIVMFKELKLDLQQVSFENDTLCLAYVKSNVLGYDWEYRRDRNTALKSGFVSVFAQFISLDGIIAHTFEKKINTNVRKAWDYIRDGKIGNGMMKFPLQVKNQHKKGFTFFYGDDDENYLLVLTTQGDVLWEKQVGTWDYYLLLTSGRNVYLLTKDNDDEVLGGFTLISYDTNTKAEVLKYKLRDENAFPLQVIAFENDPVTGKPFLSGYIVNPKVGRIDPTVFDISNETYKGLYFINIIGDEQPEVQRKCTYWRDADDANISDDGYLATTQGYLNGRTSFRDFKGNTYFAGTNTESGGLLKCKVKNGVILRQDTNGKITGVNSISSTYSTAIPGNTSHALGLIYSYHVVSSTDTKSTFLIMDDPKNTTIYNVDQSKITRIIPHKDGNIETNIYPAKEGHIIVAEYNKKEKYTKLSIEAI